MDDVDVWGIEVETFWTPVENLNFFGSLGFMDADDVDFTVAGQLVRPLGQLVQREVQAVHDVPALALARRLGDRPRQAKILLNLGYDESQDRAFAAARRSLDEAQRIKNRSSTTSQVVREIPRTRNWAMTGTPVHSLRLCKKV